MPKSALRAVVEVNVQAVTCPGVWLPRRDDVFISMRLFNQFRQTQCSSPIFPLLFHEKFIFDKIFYTAFEPSQVAESLSSCRVLVELVQLSDLYDGGRLLASYEANARDFLYPYPSYSTCYGTTDRQVLMDRTLDFPGISPKLEFSTRTVLRETAVPFLDLDPYDLDVYPGRSTSRASGRTSRSRSRTPKSTYKRPTISSIGRSRSMSPSLRHRMDALDLDTRPPFVVRKVDKDLIGRVPTPTSYNPGCDHLGTSKRQQLSTALGRSYDDSYFGYNYFPRSRISKVIREPGTNPVPVYGARYGTDTLDSDDDLEVAGLTAGTNSYYSRPRTTSPIPRTTSPYYTPYYSSLWDRYDYRPWSLAKSDLISSRVERALRRNRSLERLDYLRSTSPYSLYPYSIY